ncbi:cuticlin-3-like, partial [Dendroctonus ponderosae]|uniref:cuticlin-3-like n=1 Tax=Dendroctonus ponderosae TaxID=77166 RepID=UPI0020362367
FGKFSGKSIYTRCVCAGKPVAGVDCNRSKGYVTNAVGECVCPPHTAPNNNDDCVPCSADKGLRIDERGRCVCALERGFIIDERGNCACHLEYGYRLDARGNCVREKVSDCETNDDCPDHKYCNLETKTCDNPCATKRCGVYALCNATNHQAICQCVSGYSGNPDKYCNGSIAFRTDFPKPEMLVSCLSDGVQVKIDVNEQEGFNGVLYVKGHSKDEQCRRVLTLPASSHIRTELFKVQFGNCGLIHVNGKASFVLVIQKHPKLVTYKAQAYHIQCVYQTGEQNVTLGFNVSMLTTAGTIANTGPPPTCLMKIVTPTGQEINSAEIGDSLILQVDVQPGSIYGGFARSCVAKTMEDAVENEYLVTDENGCATDPSIFGDWEYNADTQSLLATFHAFKFPSSDNIRFQCNIRVCFGKCQPVSSRVGFIDSDGRGSLQTFLLE